VRVLFDFQGFDFEKENLKRNFQRVRASFSMLIFLFALAYSETLPYVRFQFRFGSKMLGGRAIIRVLTIFHSFERVLRALIFFFHPFIFAVCCRLRGSATVRFSFHHR
jgi:hypothetical protein